MTLHNLAFYHDLMEECRERILNGDFNTWADNLIESLENLDKEVLDFVNFVKEEKNGKTGNNNSVIFVIGATGSGKTSLGWRIASLIDGEIINADSRQFYADLPVLTARPTDKEIQNSGIIHHGFGILKKNQHTDAKWYQDWAKKKLKQVWEKGKKPVVVGGTMLWADSLIRWYDFDNKTMNKPPFSVKIFAPWHTREALYERINERTQIMFNKSGVLKEMQDFLADINEENPACHNLTTAIGLRWAEKVQSGQASKAEAIEKVAQATRKYAKRQMTWWRGRGEIVWVGVSE
jgi:tRNA A37 N6-isopentenylltransferase MiaA